jgi:hypothetical protein
MVITPRNGLVKTRKLFRYVGVGAQVQYGVHNNSLNNVRRALIERVFCVERKVDGISTLVPTIRPQSKTTIVERLSDFRSRLVKYITPLLPLTDEMFLSRYHGRKRSVYERALESLHVRGVSSKDARIMMFVKAEKLNLSAKPDPAPRAIQPRSPRYCAALGKYIAHAEKPMFKAIAKVYGSDTVFKGMNALESGTSMRAHWDAFRRPVGIGLDASRFDQHVSSDVLAWEHSCWTRYVSGPRDKAALAALLKMQIRNRGVAFTPDGVVRYVTDGCRMSGDMNTSSGNCLIMCALVYSYMKNCCPGVKYRLANNGDDCVLFMERKHLRLTTTLPEWFTECGFTMKVEDPVFDFEKIEFCQTKPVWTEQGWLMVRIPQLAMSKDLTANCDLSTSAVRRCWLDAVRKGGLALTDGCPVWPSFYRMYPATGTDSKKYDQELVRLRATGWAIASQRMTYTNVQVRPESRYSFWLAFGILPDEQVALEEWFGSRTLGLGAGGPTFTS